LLIVCAAIAVGCGPSTSVPGRIVPTATPTAKATASPTATPTAGPSNTQTIQTSTTSPVTMPPLSDGTVAVAGTLPTASVVATLTETITPTLPSGIATFTSIARASASSRRTASIATPVVYVEFTATQSVTLNGVPAFSFSDPSAVAGDAYEIALYAQQTNGTWDNLYDGPGTVNGTAISFAAAAGTLTVASGAPIVIALWDEGPAATPTPTPTPTVTPTATPIPAVTPVASPSSVNFDLSASPTPAAVSVSEPNYTGSFSAAMICTPASGQTGTAVATLTGPTTGTLFTVAPGDELGTCNLTITDTNDASTVVPVASSEANLGVFAAKRTQK
jgi:hypothetical protein